jgi:hypothetical protein
MDARKRLPALLAVIGAALAVALPAASASTATTPGTPTPDCPVGYVKNLATGCAPWWQMGHDRRMHP